MRNRLKKGNNRLLYFYSCIGHIKVSGEGGCRSCGLRSNKGKAPQKQGLDESSSIEKNQLY